MRERTAPTPIPIKLGGKEGYAVRERAAEHLKKRMTTTGAERGSATEQGFGLLAEAVIRDRLGLDDIPDDHPLGYDILLPTGVKVDVKCRGGKMDFKEWYDGSDGTPREAKHNLFARQLYEERLDADIYLMTHLTTPAKADLPGTPRQRKWTLYVCGWASKARVVREGVYLPRGSITERGRTWFAYRGQEVEFYHRHLNGLRDVADLAKIDSDDVEKDAGDRFNLHMTSVDAIRIAQDMVGRGVLPLEKAESLREVLDVNGSVSPILHPNQYFHLIEWMKQKGLVDPDAIEKLKSRMDPVEYSGL